MTTAKKCSPSIKSNTKKNGSTNCANITDAIDNSSSVQIVQETDNEAKSTAKLIKKKLAAARERGEFKTVDLFAGCGGLSLGFDRAGFRSICAVELNDDARKSHERNFGSGSYSDTYRAFADIKSTEPEDAVAHIGSSVNSTALAADIVIGGLHAKHSPDLDVLRFGTWQAKNLPMSMTNGQPCIIIFCTTLPR